ncbi:hypothetical protein EV174_000417 [Coemansia sp. RSA 2320]|nr:hypothetical protein EV174_000417 [Coemansia sp. RSA 2320]
MLFSSAARTLIAGIVLMGGVSGQEGVPTDNGEAAVAVAGVFPRANHASATSKNAIDEFVATYSDRDVASVIQSLVKEQNSLLSKHPQLQSQLYSIENEFVHGINNDNAMAHFSTLSSKLEKLSGGVPGAKPAAVAAGAAAALTIVAMF